MEEKTKERERKGKCSRCRRETRGDTGDEVPGGSPGSAPGVSRGSPESVPAVSRSYEDIFDFLEDAPEFEEN
ncbi:hypothetical protein L484_004652 [Morus notabilis]|uniref:Uncharacterized protein n=1 Tax=Morus notabilis TaxID=981085 RepID=W9RQE8_9ROSA|nr:hypothetical protein L484_004652 [Morus notabilis]